MESENECSKCGGLLGGNSIAITDTYVICANCRTDRYRVKQLTYGFHLGQWIVVDGLTVALDPVKKSDRSMWTGSEEAARHYARELNLARTKPPVVTAKSQVHRILNQQRKEANRKAATVKKILGFVKCKCGARYREGSEHTCKTV